jgi:hypothetical protein
MLQKIIMYRLHIIKRGLLFHTHPDELRIGNNNFFDWDTSMNRRPFELMVIGLLLASSLGCNTNSCGSRMTIREWFQNRPRPLRDLFTRGDDCSECSPVVKPCQATIRRMQLRQRLTWGKAIALALAIHQRATRWDPE